MDLFLILFGSLAISSPLWVLLVAVAYAIGRRQFGIRFLFVVVTIEALAWGFVGWLAWLAGHTNWP